MFIVKNRNIFFAVTALITLVALVSLFVFGLKPSLEFTGGTLVQVAYPEERPAPALVEEALDAAGFEGYSLREANERDYILRAANLTEIQRSSIAELLSGGDRYRGEITQLTEVGPTIGKELRNKAIISLVLVLLCILLFIAFAFRHVSKPISSWIYGLIALVTLLHDVIVPVGFFALLGYLHGAQIDTLFVTAILTVLGFSIHDTIVVFDRVRENLRINQERNRKEDFAETAGRSLGQTFVRSINTSLTLLLVLFAVLFFGGVTVHNLVLVLIFGTFFGAYSSIFVATPLLALWNRQKKGTA